MSLDPHEMLRYFSDFLTEINLIISTIKQHTYEIIEVSIPSPTILKVYHSMASIISSTHKTYDDLKRIESVMTGVVKARRIIDREQSHTPLARIRCRSQDGNFHQLEEKVRNEGKEENFVQEHNKQSQIRTIKRNDLSKELKLQIPSDLDKQTTAKQVGEQDKLTVKYVTDRGGQPSSDRAGQPSSDRARPLMKMKKWLQERIQKIVTSNRAGVTKIMSSNNECLRLVRSTKKQIVNK